MFRFFRYMRQAARWKKRFPTELTNAQLVRWYASWRSSLRSGGSPLADEQPWITFAAIEFLEAVLHDDALVFEFGAGGSTVFTTRRAGQVFSVEHDAQWFDRVAAQIDRLGIQNWSGKLVEPRIAPRDDHSDPSDPRQYRSSDPDFRACSFQDYASAIDELEDASLDLVLVDGRARPSCLRHALPKVKPAGYVLLDNSDRQHYQQAARLPREMWRRIELPGPSPYVDFFTQTTAWQRAA